MVVIFKYELCVRVTFVGALLGSPPPGETPWPPWNSTRVSPTFHELLGLCAWGEMRDGAHSWGEWGAGARAGSANPAQGVCTVTGAHSWGHHSSAAPPASPGSTSGLPSCTEGPVPLAGPAEPRGPAPTSRDQQLLGTQDTVLRDSVGAQGSPGGWHRSDLPPHSPPSPPRASVGAGWCWE